MSKYPRAAEANAKYEINGVTYESKRYKTLVDEADPSKEFNSVTLEYKVAQHDDVVATVEKALEDLKLKHVGEPIIVNEGARLHVHKTFPEIGMEIEGEYFNMSMTFDNSYDSTTGLRIEVGAWKQGTDTLYPVAERFASHYHKHTKGMDVAKLEDSINRGLKTFQEKVKAEFESMVVTPINPLIAAQRFQDLIKSEDCNLPDKYLQPIFNRVCERTPKTMWRLYCIVMEVMGGFKEMSVDRRRQITQSLIKEVKGMKGRVLRADAPKKVETVEGQQDLPLMMVAS